MPIADSTINMNIDVKRLLREAESGEIVDILVLLFSVPWNGFAVQKNHNKKRKRK